MKTDLGSCVGLLRGADGFDRAIIVRPVDDLWVVHIFGGDPRVIVAPINGYFATIESAIAAIVREWQDPKWNLRLCGPAPVNPPYSLREWGRVTWMAEDELRQKAAALGL